MEEELKSEFQKIHQQFEKIDQRFESMDQRFDVLEFRFGDLEERLDIGFALVHEEFGRVSTQLDGLVQSVRHLDTEDVALRARQDRLEDRVGRLERKIR